VIFILIGIAFITLLERHILRISINRLGPNKVIYIGFTQAIIDGIKLISKEIVIPIKNYKNIYFLSPIIAFIIIFIE